MIIFKNRTIYHESRILSSSAGSVAIIGKSIELFRKVFLTILLVGAVLILYFFVS